MNTNIVDLGMEHRSQRRRRDIDYSHTEHESKSSDFIHISQKMSKHFADNDISQKMTKRGEILDNVDHS